MMRSELWLVNITVSWQRVSSLVTGLTLQVSPVGNISLAHIHKVSFKQGGGEDSSPQGSTASHTNSY